MFKTNLLFAMASTVSAACYDHNGISWEGTKPANLIATSTCGSRSGCVPCASQFDFDLDSIDYGSIDTSGLDYSSIDYSSAYDYDSYSYDSSAYDYSAYS